MSERWKFIILSAEARRIRVQLLAGQGATFHDRTSSLESVLIPIRKRNFRFWPEAEVKACP
jgi:hypothetical protein